MGPCTHLFFFYNYHALAHQALYELLHENVVWACMGYSDGCRENSRIGPSCKCSHVADELELANGSVKGWRCKCLHGPIRPPFFFYNYHALARQALYELMHKNVAWACMGYSDGCRSNLQIGLSCKCTHIVRELELANGSMKGRRCRRLHGPIHVPWVFYN